jgi:hypothetical protein
VSDPGASPLPSCRRVAALYCTPEFRATEGTLAGQLCRAMSKNVDDWEALPAAAVASQEAWCRDAYGQLAAAVDERLRLFREGIGPPAR